MKIPHGNAGLDVRENPMKNNLDDEPGVPHGSPISGHHHMTCVIPEGWLSLPRAPLTGTANSHLSHATGEQLDDATAL